MRLATTLALLCVATAATAAPFPNGNAQTGQKLFQQYKCNSCHAAMLGGDGSAMFTRADRKVRSAAELVEQIRFCSGNVGANLSAQDEQHLGAYLNRYYNLK
ncbi:MAG: cytochrome c [Nitrosomonadales bacterium]|nr:cytochrome c [Nitrosomonadales bacterium]